MHEIKTGIPAPYPVDNNVRGLKYWSDLFSKMNEGDHIIIHKSEYGSLRVNAMRWRRLAEANLPYRFIGRRCSDKADHLMVWKVKEQ